ncbi:hypothetical protein GCM10022254_52990 [Actinomadura meridiana]|uniref:CdiI immunity protein domain-containing protein n=1 Tax=Actinomadura meridiana TaxID=559626 RepID=A0ABP8CE21_9ACTN
MLDDDRREKEFQDWLLLVLERLTWDAGAQLDYIDELGVGPDELALEFDDALHTVRARAADGSVPVTMSDVDAHLDEMTRQGPDAWTELSMRTSPEWSALRVLARTALIELRETFGVRDRSREG